MAVIVGLAEDTHNLQKAGAKMRPHFSLVICYHLTDSTNFHQSDTLLRDSFGMVRASEIKVACN